MTPRRALITGGAGFIGTNVAAHLLGSGAEVTILDNLSRHGVDQNLRWLRHRHGDAVRVLTGSICDGALIGRALEGVSQVYHFAAQVAVTTSLETPLADFETNARGTITLLERLRALPEPPTLLFTSTNKVYGDLLDVSLEAEERRYAPTDPTTRRHGIGEDRPLAFHSPYGCSKGAADQYVLDYARTFGLPAAVFRMSCIYGPHQFGTEDQGWVAHFLLRALDGEPITLYGDGRQVRDVLFVEDLVDAMMRAQRTMAAGGGVSGRAFNMGGGPANTTSLLELVDLLELELGRPVAWTVAPWRAADQRYYVSDCRSFMQATGWRPRVGLRAGLRRLLAWIRTSREQTVSLASIAAGR
jgi:CDP-paratose 2-epimerase